MGFPLTSILELDAAAAALSALGTARGWAGDSVFGCGDLLAGGFVDTSLEVDRWGIFLISLYLDWLVLHVSVGTWEKTTSRLTLVVQLLCRLSSPSRFQCPRAGH